MTFRPEPPAGLQRLSWRAPATTTVCAAAGSAATLLRLAEATTLASSASLRSLLDLTRPSRPTTGDEDKPEPQVIAQADEEEPEPHVVAQAGDEEPHLQVGNHADEEVRDVDQPLVPHWDELNLARIRGRLPRLALEEVRELLGYERRHGDREPVTTLLENRIRKLTARTQEEEPAPAPE